MMVDEADMQWHLLEGDEERDLKMKEAIKAMPNYDSVFKRWENASKMRQWINEKKKNLIEKIKKEVEAEYKKKKEEKKDEVPAAPEEKKASEKDTYAKEEPVKTDDIELIDTSSKPAESTETTKVEEEAPKVDGNGFSEADKVAIEDISD